MRRSARGRRTSATQIADLQQAVGELDRLIADLSSTIDERFTETYSKVEQGFADAVETLFPGGRGRLSCAPPRRPRATTRARSRASRASRASSSRSIRAEAPDVAEPAVGRRAGPGGPRLPVRAGVCATLSVLRAGRGRRRPRRRQHRALPRARRARAGAGAVRDHHAPEAHDGRRRRAVRRLDGGRRHLARVSRRVPSGDAALVE